MSEPTTPSDNKTRIATENYWTEANNAKRKRMDRNKFLIDRYNLEADHMFPHKRPGQSRETMPRFTIAVEQLTTFIQQSLMELGDKWFSVVPTPGNKNPLVSEDEARKILGEIRKPGEGTSKTKKQGGKKTPLTDEQKKEAEDMYSHDAIPLERKYELFAEIVESREKQAKAKEDKNKK